MTFPGAPAWVLLSRCIVFMRHKLGNSNLGLKNLNFMRILSIYDDFLITINKKKKSQANQTVVLSCRHH